MYYSSSSVAIETIAKYDPNAKIIAMLRCQFEFLPSLYTQMFYVMEEDQPNFEAAWQSQKIRLVGKPLKIAWIPFAYNTDILVTLVNR